MTTDADTSDSAGHLLADPAQALAAARAALDDPDLPPRERAVALCAVGCAAYYANRMPDAVRVLSEAETLTDEPGVRAEILLALAPAASKEGDPDRALRLLDDPCFDVSEKLAGQAQNQRGIILTEAGRLPEALEATEQALHLLRSADDDQRATRSLVNLGVITSMMGRLDESEQWYREARALTIDTKQVVTAAVIEGNLGYIASRRGDFASAVEWYERAQRSFEESGDVDLLVATLEADYARTLLDVGLAVDAADAAARAVDSASAGGNQMLELQGRLLLAEASLRSGELRRGGREIGAAKIIAKRFDHRASLLKVSYLEAELAPQVSQQPELDSVVAELEWFAHAGWGREAYDWMLRHAMRWWLERPAEVHDLIVATDRHTADLDVDPVARALGALLSAATSEQRLDFDRALDVALEEFRTQAELVSIAEMIGTSLWWIRPIAEIAIEHALRSDDAPARVLDAFERCRDVLVTLGRGSARGDEAANVARLRDARVSLSEAKLAGHGVHEAHTSVRELEAKTQARRRQMRRSSEREATPIQDLGSTDTIVIDHISSRGRIVSVTSDQRGTSVRELPPLDEVAPLLRDQRRALRRIGDERRPDRERELVRLRVASERLDDLLIRPLGLGDEPCVAFTPAMPVRHIAWSALPSLAVRRLTLTRSPKSWRSDDAQLVIDSAAFLGGPDLPAATSELGAVGRVWAGGDVVERASVRDALEALSSVDLLHISAHGAFRSDNPLFSSLLFADGELTVLAMNELDRVPDVVVLSSCDAAASTGRDELGADAVFGTAFELSRLGARAVIAPIVAVNDTVAAEFSVALHSALGGGASIDVAMATARRSLMETGEPVRIATACAFQVLGGQSTASPTAGRIVSVGPVR